MTQFVLIGREMPAASGNDKTMFAVIDGSLNVEEILKRTLDSRLPITSVHPRPLRTKAFAKTLVVEVGCHYQDSHFDEFKTRLGRAVEDFHILGSWPAPRRANEDVQ